MDTATSGPAELDHPNEVEVRDYDQMQESDLAYSFSGIIRH